MTVVEGFHMLALPFQSDQNSVLKWSGLGN